MVRKHAKKTKDLSEKILKLFIVFVNHLFCSWYYGVSWKCQLLFLYSKPVVLATELYHSGLTVLIRVPKHNTQYKPTNHRTMPPKKGKKGSKKKKKGSKSKKDKLSPNEKFLQFQYAPFRLYSCSLLSTESVHWGMPRSPFEQNATRYKEKMTSCKPLWISHWQIAIES